MVSGMKLNWVFNFFTILNTVSFLIFHNRISDSLLSILRKINIPSSSINKIQCKLENYLLIINRYHKFSMLNDDVDWNHLQNLEPLREIHAFTKKSVWYCNSWLWNCQHLLLTHRNYYDILEFLSDIWRNRKRTLGNPTLSSVHAFLNNSQTIQESTICTLLYFWSISNLSDLLVYFGSSFDESFPLLKALINY